MTGRSSAGVAPATAQNVKSLTSDMMATAAATSALFMRAKMTRSWRVQAQLGPLSLVDCVSWWEIGVFSILISSV